MSGSEDIANIRKNTNTRTQVRNLIKEFNLSRTLSVPTETLDYSRQQISLDGLVEVTDDNTSFIGKNYIRRGYYLTFEPDIYKLQLWHKLNAPFSISVDSSLHERNGKMFGIPLPIRGPDNGLNGSVQIATGFDGINDWVDIPHDPYIELQKVLEGFSFHIKMAPCGIDLSNGQPVTLYAKKEPTSMKGHDNAILSVIMPDGSVNVKLMFEGKEYTVSAPQYLDPDTTTFGIEKWYDHTVTFDRIHKRLELLLDNQLFNSTPWNNAHVTPYPYTDVDWHLARNSYDNRGLFWGGLADFRYYWDLKLSYQHNYNLFTNRISITQIPRGQTASIGFSYITHSLDLGFIAGFLRPKPNGQGFMTGHFIFLSEPAYNDLSIVYDMFALPKFDNDLRIIYDITYVAPVHNTLEVVYDVGEGLDDGKTSNDLYLQYDILGTGGSGGLPIFKFGSVSDLDGATIPSDIFNSMRTKGVEQAVIAGDITHTADATDELAAINRLDTPSAPVGGVMDFNIGGDFRDTPESGTNLISDTPDIILTVGDYGIEFDADDWCNNIMSAWKNSGIETWGALGNHDNSDYLNTGFFTNTEWEWTVKKNGIAFIGANTISEDYQDADQRCAEAFADPTIHTIIIIMHEGIWHPVGTSVSSDTVIEFHETFIKYKPKLKMVVCGHTHVYGRMKPVDGILYVMNGTGGQEPTSGSTSPNPFHKINSVMHCHLSADGSITCQSVPNAGDAPAVMDTFTIGANGQLPTDGVDVRPRSNVPRPLRGRKLPVLPRASAAGTNILWARGESDEPALAQIKTYAGISGTIYYKSKQVRNVYFITLDTQDPAFATAGSAQFTWCQSKLQEAANLKASGSVSWIVVAMHKPFYNAHGASQPVNTAGGVTFWQALFSQFQVDFVLQGHDEQVLEASKPLGNNGQVLGTQVTGGTTWDMKSNHGQIYMIVGGGGKTGVTPAFTTPSTWQFGTRAAFGYWLFTIDNTGLNMTVQCFNQTGSTVLNSFTVTKYIAPPPPPTCPTNQHWDSQQGRCVDNTTNPPVCPTNWHWDSTLNRCVENSTNPPPPTQNVLNISIFSDGDAGSEMTAIFNLIKSKNTHQVICCGDFTHSDAASSMNAFTAAGLDNLRPNAIWCRGNHEASNEDGSSSVQTTVAAFFNTSTTLFYKKTRIQNVYIIGTDTNDPNFDSVGSTQYNYVLASLQEAAALKAQGVIQWIIVAGHKPHYANSGTHHMPSEDDTANAAAVYQPLFNQYGVDIVFNGHNHTFQVSEPLTLDGAELYTLLGQAYDFTKPHGQIYINDGVTGRGNYTTDSANANYRYVNDSTAGFVFLALDTTGLRMKVQLVDDGGGIVHEFDIVKTTTITQPPDGGGNPPTCPTGMKWDAALGRCVDDTTTEPPPPTGGTIDANGIKWLEATGAQGVISQSRNQATDDRWSQNVTNIPNGYEVTGYFTFSGVTSGDGHWALKHWGPNHSAPCGYEESGDCCCWYDCGIRDNGDVQLQTERPHPSNHDFSIPSGANNHLYMTNIGVEMDGHCIGLKWVVYPLVVGGGASDGGMRLKMWVDTSGLLAGRPQNQWRPVYDFVDNGEVLGDYTAPEEQEIECRNSDTNSQTTYAGGLHYRKR